MHRPHGPDLGRVEAKGECGSAGTNGPRNGQRAADVLIHQISEEASRLIAAIKIHLLGEGDQEPSSDVVAQVANEIYVQDLLSLLVIHMDKLEFEVGAVISASPLAASRQISLAVRSADLIRRPGRTHATSTALCCGDSSGPARPPSSTSRAGLTSSLPRSSPMRTRRSRSTLA